MKLSNIILTALLLTISATYAQKLNNSKIDKYTFSEDLATQEDELARNPMLKYYQQQREDFRGKRHYPLYHFTSPEGKLNDPNGLCYWQGNWHLFYQAYPKGDPRQHWGHAISKDLLYWRDLPLAIYPEYENRVFSGATYVEDDRVIAMYHGWTVGNFIATADDPLLLNWDKMNDKMPVIPERAPHEKNSSPDGVDVRYRVFDPCVWQQGEYYYSLSGGTLPNVPSGERVMEEFLFRSKDLVEWEYMHPFMENNIFSAMNDDGACPYFLPIDGGKKYVLLHFSHLSGGQYFIGDYDTVRQKFIATSHGKLNHGSVVPGGLHAPSAFVDGEGGIIAIFNINSSPVGNHSLKKYKWDHMMTLPMRLTLSEDQKHLNIEPAVSTESLHASTKSLKPFTLEANKEMKLKGISGDAMEIELEFDNKQANSVEINVLVSPNKQEYTKITLYKRRDWRVYGGRSNIVIDNTYSSILAENQSRAPEVASMFLSKNETVKMRIFIDKSVVEVYVNGRQYLCERVYPGLKESLGVTMKAVGSDAEVLSFKAHQMKSIW